MKILIPILTAFVSTAVVATLAGCGSSGSGGGGGFQTTQTTKPKIDDPATKVVITEPKVEDPKPIVLKPEPPKPIKIRLPNITNTLSDFYHIGNGDYRLDFYEDGVGIPKSAIMSFSRGFEIADIPSYKDLTTDIMKFEEAKMRIEYAVNLPTGGWYLGVGGNSVSSLPRGTYLYGGPGKSVNFVRGGTVVSPNYGVGYVNLEANFEKLTGTMNGVTLANQGSGNIRGTVGTNVVGTFVIDTFDGSFVGAGSMSGLESGSSNVRIVGNFHGVEAEAAGGIYYPTGRTLAIGGFIAKKR